MTDVEDKVKQERKERNEQILIEWVLAGGLQRGMWEAGRFLSEIRIRHLGGSIQLIAKAVDGDGNKTILFTNGGNVASVCKKVKQGWYAKDLQWKVDKPWAG